MAVSPVPQEPFGTAGSVLPPKIWGTFFTLKGEIDEDHQSPE
jgi:hypothetical protein